MSDEQRKRSWPLKVGVSVVGLGVGVALMAWSAVAPANVAPQRSTGEVFEVNVELNGVRLACPPGIIDPDSSSESGGTRTSNATDSSPMSGGGEVELVGSGDETGLVISGAQSGDVAGMLVEGCMLPSRHLLAMPGSTVVGERSVLILSNPSPKSVESQISLYGALGPLLEAPLQEVVPANSTTVVVPAIAAADQEVVAVEITSDGAGVAAWLQTSGLDGEVSQGVARTPASAASTPQVIAGIDRASAENLLIFNPGTNPVEAALTVLTEEGNEPLGGAATTTIAGRSVSTVSLASLPEGTKAIEVDADDPIFAAATMVRVGKKHEDVTDATYFSRAYLTGATLATNVTLPTSEEVEQAAESIGAKVKDSTVTFANPRRSAVSVTYGDETVEVAGGSAVSVAAPQGSTPTPVSSTEPIAITQMVVVDTDRGTLTVPIALGGQGTASQQRFVTLFPTL